MKPVPSPAHETLNVATFAAGFGCIRATLDRDSSPSDDMSTAIMWMYRHSLTRVPALDRTAAVCSLFGSNPLAWYDVTVSPLSLKIAGESDRFAANAKSYPVAAGTLVHLMSNSIGTKSSVAVVNSGGLSGT